MLRQMIRKNISLQPSQVKNFVDTASKSLRFDAVLSFDIEPAEAIGILCSEVKEAYPDFDITIVPDTDISDWRGALFKNTIMMQ